MNVPKLRFKEFNDEWTKEYAGNLCSIQTGKSNTQDKVDDGIYPFYVRSKIVEKSHKYIFDTEAVLTVGDGVGVGKVFHYINGKFDCHQRVYMMNNFKNITAKYFYYIFSRDFDKRVMKMTAKTSVDSVRYEMIDKMEIYYPTIKEQLKVANFLSLLDKKIELQSKKIEDLKLFKKGLINVLNKKSYQETALGKIGKFQTSSIDKLVKGNEKIVNLYNYMDVYKHKILMTQDLKKLSKTSAKDNQITINNLKRGDILFTPSSETPDDIGHSICIQEDLPNTVYSYHLLRYRPNIIMDPLFSNYYFNNSKIRKQIIRYATGATRYTISLDSFLKIKVDIPDLITQKKYGLLLYSTDKKVNKELFKLNKLQELKKGLIQDMFV